MPSSGLIDTLADVARGGSKSADDIAALIGRSGNDVAGGAGMRVLNNFNPASFYRGTKSGNYALTDFIDSLPSVGIRARNVNTTGQNIVEAVLPDSVFAKAKKFTNDTSTEVTQAALNARNAVVEGASGLSKRVKIFIAGASVLGIAGTIVGILSGLGIIRRDPGGKDKNDPNNPNNPNNATGTGGSGGGGSSWGGGGSYYRSASGSQGGLRGAVSRYGGWILGLLVLVGLVAVVMDMGDDADEFEDD